MTQEELRQLVEYNLAEYMGTENAKNLDKFGTPENQLVNQLMVLTKQFAEEVIGEDLETTNYMYFYKDKYKNVPEDFKETIIKACIQYDNDLKKEQRKRAGL